MKKYLIISFVILFANKLNSQNGLVNTNASPHAKLSSVGLSDVQWTKGFWAERFDVCRDAMVPSLWQTYTSKDICYSFQNFRIAAGLDTGRFRGPSFHDGDFYKTQSGNLLPSLRSPVNLFYLLHDNAHRLLS